VEELTLTELTDLVGGESIGRSTIGFTGIADITDAKDTEIGVLIDPAYLSKTKTSKAGALLVSQDLSAKLSSEVCQIVSENPRKAVALLLDHFYSLQKTPIGVHSTAIVHENAQIGNDFYAGPYVVVEDCVNIGDGVKIHSHSVIQRGVEIGNEVVIHSHVVICPSVRIGSRVTMQAGSRIGTEGFGYFNSGEKSVRIPHVGGCILGDDTEIGANTCIDRGSLGDTVIENGVKIDNLVHVAHNVVIGANTLLSAQVGIAGSTKIGIGTKWGGQSGVAGHIEIGDYTEISAKAGVIEDSAPHSRLAGFPAKDLKEFLRGQAHIGRIEGLRKQIRELREIIKGHFTDDSHSEKS